MKKVPKRRLGKSTNDTKKDSSCSSLWLATTAKLQGAELPGVSDFHSALERWRKGGALGNYELLFWTTHFSKMLEQSLSAVATCLNPGVSQQGLMQEAEEIFGKRIEAQLSDFIPIQAIASLRDTVFKILVFFKRAVAQKASAGADDEILRQIIAALSIVEAWHRQPKARAQRRVQRRKKTKSAPRKYNSDFMDQCSKLIAEALQEQFDHIGEKNYDPDIPFTPSCFNRRMPTGLFGMLHTDIEDWTKWIVAMLDHRSRKGDLCALTLRKRKQEIRTVLIPKLWDEVWIPSR